MINLVKNEFIKIFNKKSTYIMFALILIFVGITNYIYKENLDENGYFKTEIYDSSYLENAKEELKNIKDSNDKEYENSLRKDIMIYELYEKYGVDSWQSYIIGNEMYYLIDELVKNRYNDEKDYELLNELENKYKFYIEKFDNDDWKYFVNLEKEKKLIEKENIINDIKYSAELKEHFNKSYDIELEVLNYRLENNISYAKSYLNTALNEYLNASKNVIQLNKDDLIKEDKIFPEGSLLHGYYRDLSSMNVNKYILDNKIDSNKKNDTRGILMNLYNEYELYIIFAIIFICSGIVSYEFNKGTIKNLLLVPYSKTQILLSKYITCILISLLTIILTITLQLIIGGITFGFSTMNIPVVVYNINNSIIETYNIFHYLLIMTISKLPMIIILITIILLINTLSLNTGISMVFGIILYISTPIVSSLGLNTNMQFLNYLILPHWDFSQYLFGMISDNYYITINMSIALSIIYFIVFLIPTFILFNKKDIKNM